MRGAHTEGGLDGEGRNTGGAKEAVRGEHHQVGGHPGSGRRVEAGYGDNGGHGPEGWKIPEIHRDRKKLHFSRDGPREEASNLQGSKTATFGVLSKLVAVHL